MKKNTVDIEPHRAFLSKIFLYHGTPNTDRPLSADEQRIVNFIAHAINSCQDNIKMGAKSGRYGTANDAQHRAIILSALRFALISGYHDADHPTKEIDPVSEAKRLADY